MYKAVYTAGGGEREVVGAHDAVGRVGVEAVGIRSVLQSVCLAGQHGAHGAAKQAFRSVHVPLERVAADGPRDTPLCKVPAAGQVRTVRGRRAPVANRRPLIMQAK